MKLFHKIIVAMFVLALSATAQAVEKYKPFVLAQKTSGSVDAVAADVRSKLTTAGFTIAGDYSPYPGTQVIIITTDALRQFAAKSEHGGYGAAQRVGVTKVGSEVQVSFTNPVYMGHAYRMDNEGGREYTMPVMNDLLKKLTTTLGFVQNYGSEDGIKARKLRKYHYMFGMEYFDEPSELNVFPNFEQAVKTVEGNLAKGLGGVTQVYRIDIPGKKEVVFGVAMKKPDGGDKYMDDKYIMGVIDFEDIRSPAHLPYEIMVSGRTAYAQYARFRIAINFPDLSMMGDNSFMNIVESPEAIRKALVAIAGGKTDDSYWD